eukprot:TRINITY_DN5726_c0_g1_i1.p1 TRINITY_DN5726_c0_g1~~TRINITY_DN5726_c0_g1_i1.p1  ORF type:complete len:190 (-),score=15.24 TRINITY_DN5726_c0_g1_i1:163-732(-)
MLSITSANKLGSLSTRTQRRAVAVRAQEEIYIGNGRFVKDDPKKYPSRTPLTGGWAGGENGLREFIAKTELRGKDSKEVRRGPATKLLGGKDVIYTGKGNYVRDDAQKYPSRTAVTGGFAGGERGVRKFVAEGDIQFEDEFRPQNSPLIVALAMSGVAIVVSSIWFAIGAQRPLVQPTMERSVLFSTDP